MLQAWPYDLIYWESIKVVLFVVVWVLVFITVCSFGISETRIVFDNMSTHRTIQFHAHEFLFYIAKLIFRRILLLFGEICLWYNVYACKW